VMGAAWLQSGTFVSAAFLVSLPPSLWVLNILLINEIPDIDADAAAGKRTLPVRWGLRGTWTLYVATNTLALVAVTIAVAWGLMPAVALAGPGALLAVALYVAGTLARGAPDRFTLTAAIKATLGIHALGTVWLVAFAWP
jgi:1,4-dihydroxy-2-naphthoate octaprenyltransferase